MTAKVALSGDNIIILTVYRNNSYRYYSNHVMVLFDTWKLYTITLHDL